MTPEQFNSLAAQQFNRIPLVREVLADLDTPLSTYLKLADQPYTYLFESVEGGEKWGRYSIIGLPARKVLKVYGYRVDIEVDNQVVESFEVEDPLAYVEAFQANYQVPELEGLPRFNGGLVGYFGYDCVRYVEKRLKDSTPPDVLGTPDILLMVSDEVVVFDNLSGKLILVCHVDPANDNAYENGQARLDTLVAQLRFSTPHIESVAPRTVDEDAFESSFGEEAFKQAVDTTREYIFAGDIMQAVVSQRMSIPFERKPLDLYRALRCLNPSPYMYLLNLGDFHIVGSSPEILARVEDGVVTVRPIAGTRRRGHTEAEDKAFEKELLADPKEIAEHVMLIDLGRNDVGRVAQV
ncbi:MAG: anthranilate synthase component I family protein, partial [Pontibacterium sp.]